MNKIKIMLGGIAAAGLLSAGTVKAQEEERTETVVYTSAPEHDWHAFELGFRYIPMFTSLQLNTYNGQTVKGDVTMGNGFGVMYGTNFSRHVGLQIEADYQPIMQKYKDFGLDREVHVNYLNIPVMLVLNTDKSRMVNFNVHLGPQFGLNIGSNIKTSGTSSETTTTQAAIAVKPGDVGAVYGAGFDFALNPAHTIRLDLGFRGAYGLVNINAKPGGNNEYNVLVNAARKSYGGYAGITFAF